MLWRSPLRGRKTRSSNWSCTAFAPPWIEGPPLAGPPCSLPVHCASVIFSEPATARRLPRACAEKSLSFTSTCPEEANRKWLWVKNGYPFWKPSKC